MRTMLEIKQASNVAMVVLNMKNSGIAALYGGKNKHSMDLILQHKQNFNLVRLSNQYLHMDQRLST